MARQRAGGSSFRGGSLLNDRHEIDGGITPASASQHMAERLKTSVPLGFIRVPCEQPVDDVVDILRVGKKHGGESGCVALGYTCRGGHHSGNAATNSLLHIQAI